jgi:predicted dehydrogenase
MQKVRVGIIGTGYTIGIAEHHIKAYRANERAELVAVYDIQPGRAAEWLAKKKIAEVAVCDSLTELFSKVDAVSICTPNHTHIALTIQAIEAGKHVICEKPYALSYEEGLQAVQCAQAHPGVVAAIGFNYREIPAVKYLKQMIDSGKIGKVFYCRQELGGSRIADPTGVKLEWRMQEALSGSGALADFGCHMLDLADYLLSPTQGKICEVQAIRSTLIPERLMIGEERPGVVTNDDCAAFNAKMSGGTLLTFLASRIGLPRQMLEMVGEGGMLIFNGNPNEVEVWLKDKRGGYDSKNRHVVPVPDELKGEEGHKGLVNEFIAAILDETPVARNLERGLYIQYLLDLFRKSAQEGRSVTLQEGQP